MKRTASVVIGAVLATMVVACSDDPEHTEVCVDDNDIIQDPSSCEQGKAGAHFVYVPSSTYVGSHGSKLTGSSSTVKPAAGSIGRAPSVGGFGGHGGGSGS